MDAAALNLNLGSTQRKFLYQKGTADEIVIAKALKASCYNFGPLRHAAKLSELYQRLIRTGKSPLILDVGANIGASSVYFSCSFPKAHLIAIEDDESKFQFLTANTIDLPVECIFSTVVPTIGGGRREHNDRDKEQPQKSPPSSLAINQIYKQVQETYLPYIAKIDIERCEAGLFDANTEWIDQTPVIIVELSDSLIPGTSKLRNFVKRVSDLARDFIYLNDNIFSVDRKCLGLLST